MRSIVAICALGSLSLSLTVALWRASVENARLEQSRYESEMALLTAQDEAQDLKARLPREIKGREFAEAGQRSAESAERTTREKLAQETKAFEAKLAQETATRKLAEGALVTAENQVRVLSTKLEEVAAAKLPAETYTKPLVENGMLNAGPAKPLVARKTPSSAKNYVRSLRMDEKRKSRLTWLARLLR